MRHQIFILILLFSLPLFIIRAQSTTIEGSRTSVSKEIPNEGEPVFSYYYIGAIGYDYVANNNASYINRSMYEFNLSNLAGTEITDVTLEYSTSNGNASYSFKITHMSYESDAYDLFTGIPNGDDLFGAITYGSGGISNSQISNLVKENKGGEIFLGVYALDESDDGALSDNVILEIHVNYTVPPQNVTFTANNNFYDNSGNNTRGSMIIDGSPETIPDGRYEITKEEGQNTTLEAVTPQTDIDGHERIWHTETENQSYWSKNGEYSGNNKLKTFTISEQDEGATYLTHLRKNFTIVRDKQTEFDGAFSDGVIENIVNGTSDQISAPLDTVINNKEYEFAGWTDDFSAPRTRTISPNDNETYSALYKYPHHSNKSGTYERNNQKKFVQTLIDGHLHKVYKSMGHVWYERSTDGGNTWEVMNNGRPLDDYSGGDNPSIDFTENASNQNIFIAFQRGGSADIVIQWFHNGVFQYEDVVYSHPLGMGALEPVVSVSNSAGRLTVVWRKKNMGLFYRFGQLTPTDNDFY